jgi:predicted glutamine amidotransferase
MACELFAFSFHQEVPIGPAISSFWRHGEKNPHGWGLAYYPDSSAVLFKRPGSVRECRLAKFLAGDSTLKTKILIAHVRKASSLRTAPRAHRNSHPFLRELDGKEYVFAHNGTLKEYRAVLNTARFKPLGETDSECLFCHLLEKIGRRGNAEWYPSSFQRLQKELQAVNDLGKMNCIFSDGTHLFAYQDKKGYNRMYSIAWQVGPSAVGIAIATKPLQDEPWLKISPGQLMVWRDGMQVFPEASGK